jgi:hypothetical protein
MEHDFLMETQDDRLNDEEMMNEAEMDCDYEAVPMEVPEIRIVLPSCFVDLLVFCLS